MPDLPNNQSTTGSYTIRIHDGGTSLGNEHFGVQTAGAEVLTVKEGGMLKLAGEDASLSRSGGTVQFNTSAGSGAAFEFATAGTARLTITRTDPVAVPRLSIGIVTSATLPPATAEGQVLVHRVSENNDWVYYLCVSVASGSHSAR